MNAIRLWTSSVPSQEMQAVSPKCRNQHISLRSMLILCSSCVNLLSNAIKFTENMPTRKIRVRLGATKVTDGLASTPSSNCGIGDLLPACIFANYCAFDEAVEGTPVLLHVAVSDTGHGMTTEEQGRMFRRFAQASPKTYR
jgi:signal transduction histidine kinase